MENDVLAPLYGGFFPEGHKTKGVMAGRFLVPPFSVLNARDGDWRERKRAWICFGIKGEEGRTNHKLNFSPVAEPFGYRREKDGGGASGVCYGTGGPASIDDKRVEYAKRKKRLKPQPFIGGIAGEAGVPGRDSARYKKKRPNVQPGGEGGPHSETCWICSGGDQHKKWKGKVLGGLGISESSQRDKGGYENDDGSLKQSSGTSVFDPVLCELMYRWFCPKGGRILDPFAGESTKGIVASALGYQYTGCELRCEQVEANRKQAIITGTSPEWILGDSSKIERHLPEKRKYDFIWTSPPYYDLEIYSKLEKDGSAFETYEKFMNWYENIFRQCVRRLKKNRFLAVKIGEIRDKRGIYRNFVGDNVACFTRLGLHYYNEMILVTAVGSLPIRCGKQFNGYRKVGKTHQNILCFYKGNPKAIKEEFGPCS